MWDSECFGEGSGLIVKERVSEVYKKRGDFSVVVSVDLRDFASEVTESVRGREGV